MIGSIIGKFVSHQPGAVIVGHTPLQEGAKVMCPALLNPKDDVFIDVVLLR